MEELVQKQNEDGVAIQQFINNIKKAPLERRTQEFFQSKILELDSHWKKISDRDNVIRRSYGNDMTHPYFVNDFYSAMANKINPFRDEMLQRIEQFKKAMTEAKTQKHNDGPSSSNVKPHIAETQKHNDSPSASNVKPHTATQPTKIYDWIKKQKAIIDTVTKLLNQVLSEQSTQPTRYYTIQVRSIEQHWEKARELHHQIWDSINVIDPSIYSFDEYIQIESTFYKQFAMLEEMATEKSDYSQNDRNHHIFNPSIKLPRIELPTYDGDLTKWTQFRDLFVKLVDKQSIPLCQKMWYLKSSLSGEAAGLIQHFSATAANYASAWQVVNDRFENHRLLVNATLNRLLAQPYANNDAANALKSLHDTTRECLMTLQNLDIDVKGWDPILLHILVKRLHKTTHTLWEQSLQDPKQLPTLDDFLKFLKSRFQSLEVLGLKVSPLNKIAIEQTKGGTYRTLTAAIVTNSRCIACKEDHPIFKCPKFEKMLPSQRLSLIQRFKCCVNCLKNGHSAKICPSGTCTMCHKKHNTLLHLESKQPTPISTKMASSISHVPKQNIDSAPSGSITLSAVQKGSIKATNVLLSTVCLAINNKWGQPIQCRAILDSGSQANFITKRLVTKLGLQRGPCLVDIEGIGQTQGQITERVNLTVTSIITAFTKNIEAHVLTKIVSDQPSRNLEVSKWNIPNNIQLADPTFYNCQSIDLLIGAGLFFSSLCVGQISLGQGLPILQNSMFWVVSRRRMQSEGSNTYPSR